MKNIINKLIYQIVRIDFLWFFIAPFPRLFSWFTFHRNVIIENRGYPKTDGILEKICKDPIVKHGPFKGLIYPDFTAFGSAIYPKIIGCYEREIQPAIDDACRKKYTEIIDVGCAEGYYAVGLALRIKDSRIYAYDTDIKAAEYCRRLAELNGVANRIILRGNMTAADLANFVFEGRGLIICDCEGFEMEIFTKESVINLMHCDLIIEMHDFININISEYILKLFSDTHNMQIFQSIDDIVKARTYDYTETRDLDLTTKKKMFAEGRPALMEWVYLESKNYKDE